MDKNSLPYRPRQPSMMAVKAEARKHCRNCALGAQSHSGRSIMHHFSGADAVAGVVRSDLPARNLGTSPRSLVKDRIARAGCARRAGPIGAPLAVT
jgi:hypothetical protein